MPDSSADKQQKEESEKKRYQDLRLAAERKYKQESEEIIKTLKANKRRIEEDAKDIVERVEEAMRRLGS